MQCPKCGNPVNQGQKFCTKCGQPLNAAPQQSVKSSANVCPNCGAPLNPGQKFCTKCGTNIAVAQQTAPQQGAPGQKGFWNNVTHPGEFIRHGSEGVNRVVRREQEAQLQQQAQAMGLEVNKPPRNGQQPIQGVASQQVPQGGQQPVDNVQQPQSRRLTVDSTSVEGVNLVSGRAIWDIHKGEVARLVTESEFAAAENMKGVIVQEGCTAMIYVDGQFISMMQAGIYTFPAKTEAERQLDQRQRDMEAEEKELEKKRKAIEEEEREKRQAYEDTFEARGVFGEIAAFGRGISNFFFGKKKDETPQQHKQRVDRMTQKIKSVPSPKLCRVYIITNRVISLLFGSQETDGVIDFAPITIPSKIVDVNIGVSMQLEITNMQEFVKNYLADRKSVSILDFQDILTPGVKATLTQMLRNLDYQQDGLPEPVVNNLKNKLQQTCNQRIFGIQVKAVLDITDQSADFERFRAVERELYCSEKELGFLQRTGEFRNRLEQEQNKQTIAHAQTEEELRRALQAINTDQTKDMLLNKDELEQFVMLLESQARIRKANLQKDEAIAMEEVREALIDMKKSGLVKDDELAALEHQLLQGRMDRDDETASHENEIEQRRIDRENVTEIMRIQASQKAAMAQQIADFELSDSKMENDMANELRKAQHQGNLAAAQLDTKRLMDAYNDERNEFDWNRAFSRRQQEDEYNDARQDRQDERDWNKQQHQQQADNQQALFEQQLREQQAQADYNRQRQDKMDDIDILERKGNIAMRNMQVMKEAELRAQQEANRSAESLHGMDIQRDMHRDDVEATMDADQLMAKNIQGMDAAAQTEFAKTRGTGRENELLQKQQAEQKELYERMMNQQNSQNAQNQQMMMQMAQMMQQGMIGMGQQQAMNQQQMFNQQQQFQQQRYDDQMQMKNEYRENMMHQQSRMDYTQDQAMGSMSQINTAAAGNLYTNNSNTNVNVQGSYGQQPQQGYAPQQPEPQYRQEIPQQQGRICPACGAQVPDGEMFCGECGQKM